MEYKRPESLLSINRLDVFLKKLYFDVIGGGRTRDASLIISLYRKHILQRTGGIEPPDLNRAEHHIAKTCIDDYEREAMALYRSMADNGFREDRAIAISGELLLVNGAHRLAAALSLGLNAIPVVRSSGGGIWDAKWFLSHFNRKEYLFLLEEYARSHKNAAPILLWGVTEDCWPEIISVLEQRGLKLATVQLLDFCGNFDGFYRFVHELYGVEPKSNDNIRRKAIIHGSFSTRLLAIQVEPLPDSVGPEHDFLHCLSEIKREIRGEFNGRIRQELFLTLHAPTSEIEKQRMLSLLYSTSSIRFYRGYRFNQVSSDPALCRSIEGLRQSLDHLGVSKKDVCIVGSAVFGVFGIRLPADIDLAVSSSLNTEKIRAQLGNFGEYEVVPNGYSIELANGSVSTDELIHSSRYHFCLGGLKFADLYYVFLKKKKNGIPKDVLDQALLRKALGGRRTNKQTKFMRDELLWLEGVVRGITQ